MKINRILLSIALVSACSFAACKKEAEPDASEVTPVATESEVPGVASQSDLSPAAAEARIDDVTTGHALAADGSIDTGQGGDDFAPGETVHIAMKVGDTPAGSAVKVVWYGPEDKRINEETKTVETGQVYLNFQADTKGWAKGDYKAEIWIGDENVNTERFQVVDAANAGR
ncbi:MAG TPA: hypothetical protein VGS22_26100 [Thermoanaerobaculia bacterium]|jgi:hypothetical protein|nr:hypothetical protein [Thermoanaerobaculia bacterium]